jgi:hypothetical protein
MIDRAEENEGKAIHGLGKHQNLVPLARPK